MKNKKKLVIFALIAVMVLTVCVTALAGCSDVPKGYREIKNKDEYSVQSPLSEALYNTVMENGLDNLKFGTELTVDTKYGDVKKSYLIKMNAQLAFNIKDNNTNTFCFQVLDKAADNANILTVFYKEDSKDMAEYKPEGEEVDPTQIGNGDVYVAIGSGSNAQYFKIKALSIKSVLRTQYMPNPDYKVGSDLPEKVHPSIDEEAANGISDTISTELDKIFSYVDTISGACRVFESKNKDSIILRIDLAKILKDFESVINEAAGEFNTIIKGLGLDLDLTKLKEILPTLKADLTFNFAGVDKGAENPYESATISGVGVKLDAKKKDFKINKTDGTEFIRINIAKDFTADVMFSFAYGDAVQVPVNTPVQGNYKAINAINFTAKGELKLNKCIELNINLGGEKSLIIPAGDYNINLAANLDPTQLIGIDFTNLKGASADKILEVVSQVLNNVVYKLKIEISDKNSDKKLLIDIYKEDESIMLTADTSLLSGTLMEAFGVFLKPLAEDPMELGAFIESIKGSIKPSADSKTEADNKAQLIATIGSVIKNMSIVANAGKLTVDLKNFSVAENKEYGEDGETVVKDNGDTTLDAKVEADKNGLTVDAAIKNMILDGKASSITAKITANSNGVTLTAKSEEGKPLNVLGGIDVDLVLKLTEFKYGACK